MKDLNKVQTPSTTGLQRHEFNKVAHTVYFITHINDLPSHMAPQSQHVQRPHLKGPGRREITPFKSRLMVATEPGQRGNTI